MINATQIAQPYLGSIDGVDNTIARMVNLHNSYRSTYVGGSINPELLAEVSRIKYNAPNVSDLSRYIALRESSVLAAGSAIWARKNLDTTALLLATATHLMYYGYDTENYHTMAYEWVRKHFREFGYEPYAIAAGLMCLHQDTEDRFPGVYTEAFYTAVFGLPNIYQTACIEYAKYNVTPADTTTKVAIDIIAMEIFDTLFDKYGRRDIYEWPEILINYWRKQISEVGAIMPTLRPGTIVKLFKN